MPGPGHRDTIADSVSYGLDKLKGFRTEGKDNNVQWSDTKLFVWNTKI